MAVRAHSWQERPEVFQDVIQHFLSTDQTLSFAESCTGGGLSAKFTSHPGVSKFFKGAIVSYANETKSHVLGVPDSLLRSVGAVSLPVANSMARGAKRVLNTDWAVAITGVAGPGGGSADKPVGTVCFAVCGPGIEELERIVFPLRERDEIQNASINYATYLLWQMIKGERVATRKV